jgi:uncharacterized protein (DUF2336 family)
LACDQPDVAGPVLHRSPLLLDADLVEAVASGEVVRQAAVAMRALLPCSVAAAIAEVGCAEACLVLLENPHAEIVPFSLDRIVDRHGHLAAIRDSLLARSDLPATTRQALVVKLSDTLAEFVTAREWLGADRARRVTREACERATVVLAAESPESEVRPLIRHLCESGQLNAGLILRSLLSGNASSSRRRWPSLPAFRSPASPASSTTAAARASAPSTTRQGFRPPPSSRFARRSRPFARTASWPSRAVRAVSSAA